MKKFENQDTQLQVIMHALFERLNPWHGISLVARHVGVEVKIPQLPIFQEFFP